MSLNHLKRQMTKLKRRARFGEREAEAAQKRQEARLEKFDLERLLLSCESRWLEYSNRWEAGEIPQEEEPDKSDYLPPQEALERFEYLCELRPSSR